MAEKSALNILSDGTIVEESGDVGCTCGKCW